MAAEVTPEQAMQLLDFNQKFDITLLDKVVDQFYSGFGQQQQVSQQVLTQLKEHPDSWTKVDAILAYSNNLQTKYFALQLLEDVIKTRWKALPREQCEGIKKFIVGLVIKHSANPNMSESEKTYCGKLDMILVQIVKYEWPHNWPTFISEIVGASKTSESLCQNNMTVLKLLSEEVFDFSSGQMTQAKAKHLKDTMCGEFSEIFQLCNFVMESSQSLSLVGATLETLLRFLNWIPLGYIFETKLISTLILKFLNVPTFRNVTLKCLTEIAAVSVGPDQYTDELCTTFNLLLVQLKQMLPLTTNIKDAYKSGQDDEQNFIQNLALFLTTFLTQHGQLLERTSELRDALMEALHYLVLISDVDEKEIFKICLEYWNSLAANLYQENPFSTTSPLMLSAQAIPPRRQIYLHVLSKVRLIMISHMVKPEEVLVVENDQGEAVREFMKDTYAITMYKSMRETLVYLTHLDYADTEELMTQKLYRQVDNSEWSWKNLNTLCWAIGSISGAMHEEDEKRFLVTVIKELLGLCEMKRGKDNKAIVASNIMYIVGQYPRFLRAHWKFLKTVVNKLFEFMHETHDGVQDMACDTFIKISQKCKRHFVVMQPNENLPFIEEILNNISSIICDLQPHQVHTFYEAVGYMIAAQLDQVVQERLVEKYMALPNQIWDNIIAKASQDVNELQNAETIKQLGHILKTNVRACSSTGHPFVTQLGKIYLDMLNVYKCLSENISQAVTLHGNLVIKQPLIASMRVVKKETLKLISCWVSHSQDPVMIKEHFLPPLLDAILLDYKRNVPSAREPEVLSTITSIIDKAQVTESVPHILDALFECTLDMINKDLEEFPDHRINFFKMLQSINMYCFDALLLLSAPQFKVFLDSIIWGFKHTMRNVAEIGLQILLELLHNVETSTVAQSFYQSYLLELIEHMFSVITDSSHAGNLTQHATILAYMMSVIENSKVTAPLFDAADPSNNGMNNLMFVQTSMAKLLKQAFPHLQDGQIKVTIIGLFELNDNIPAFKNHLRDFLAEIKEHAGDDITNLYLEEREVQLQQAAEEKRNKMLAVPGIINPHDRPDDMQQE
ncbi:exportin-1-like [Dysidea avara]|uniref:exportin-1-like n=1 Tax=Dysidea avara TaxID=196820 RepID=UPI00331C5BF8